MSEDAKVYAEKVALLQLENAKLKSELIMYKRHIFGQKSERFISSGVSFPGQHTFDPHFFGVSIPETVEPPVSPTPEPAREKQKPVRKPLDESKFEVLTEEVQPDEDVSQLKYIGVEESTHQVLVDAKVVLKKIRRYKYLNTATGKIIIADLPYRPFSKSAVSASIVAEVVVQKFVDAMPIYRQEQAWRRLGVDFPYSSLSDMQRMGYKQIQPLFEAFSKNAFETNYLQVDESPYKVLTSEKKGATHIGYQWVCLDPVRNIVLYNYRPGKTHAYADDLLKDFTGVIQTDGYDGYDKVAESRDIEHIYCMAHARRYFEKALDNEPVLSRHFLQELQKLYQIEKEVKGQNLSGQEIIDYRGQHALPVLQSLKKWLDDQLPKVTPRSSFGKAVLYSAERWQGLMKYCNYSHTQIDNNPVERSIRPMVVGRKNYLFAGSHESAERAACYYSFFITCRMHNVNPKAWIEDVFNKIEITKPSQYHTLFPQNWTK